MRRLTATSAFALCVALAAPVSLTPSALAAKAPKPADARARLVACTLSLDPAKRALTVDASMRSLMEDDRMQMRFELLQRASGRVRFRKLAGPGLGTWNPATPGVDRYRFRKPIQNLPVPYHYIVKVTFRWLNPDGTPYARTARFTSDCFQPDRRPDLRIVSISRPERFQKPFSNEPAWSYNVVLRNAGRTPSRDFVAVLTVNGVPQQPTTASPIGPAERQALRIFAPRCDPGSTVRLELDPDNRVDEANETNNSRSYTC